MAQEDLTLCAGPPEEAAMINLNMKPLVALASLRPLTNPTLPAVYLVLSLNMARELSVSSLLCVADALAEAVTRTTTARMEPPIPRVLGPPARV